jgi:sulfite reductase (ferredoxin)
MSGDAPSKVEEIKRTSRGLRGMIAEELARPTELFGPEDVQLLKFHGTYQQYDRDTATERKNKGLDKEYQFMVRLRIPGGKLTPEQYLAVDEIAGKYGNGTLRITTRQTFQLHGVLKKNLWATIHEVNETLLTTIGACGDVVRNVITNPAPIKDYAHRRMDEDAALLSRELRPATNAYHEIWIDGEKVGTESEPEPEPLYGETYLPRKFKIAIGTPDDNTVDVLANDLAIIPLFENDSLVGYNVALGGGLGMTHNKPETYPRLASPVVFVGPDDLVRIAKAVVSLQRDYGNRSNRRRARLKYVVDDKGIPWLKAELEKYFGGPLEDPHPMPPFQVKDHMGWHRQGDGKWYLGLHVPNGRIADVPGWRMRTAIRETLKRFPVRPILSTTQDLILAEIVEDQRQSVEDFLVGFGVLPGDSYSKTRRASMACPALPTCGLALTEAERVQPQLMDKLEALMKKHGIEGERMAIRMTGCPNGCARPYIGDIGFVGRTPGYYAVFVGGDFEGTRLNQKLFERVKFEDIPALFDQLFALYVRERFNKETFGDFCHRKGIDALHTYLSDASGSVTAAAL